MLLKLTTTHRPATDLGYLLHKNPAKCQEFDLSFGKAHVFYPQADEDRCTAALLLDVNPIDLIRGKNRKGGLLDQYVNDRPFTASSFLSVAISQVYGTALGGRSKERSELAKTPIPLEAQIAVMPSRGGEDIIRRLFEPLDYEVEITSGALDEMFPEWGDSYYYTVLIRKICILQELLTHLYVLVPVLDNYKHYYIGDQEREKLLAKGEGWLATHPEKEMITKRYLKYQMSLARQALAQMAEEDQVESLNSEPEAQESEIENTISLNDQRIGAVMAAVKASGARRILDLGCGDGKLIRELLKEKSFEQIVGMDVSIRSLEVASERLRLDSMPEMQRKRIELIHGSLMYRDARLSGFDTAIVIEVIEHLDPPRLKAFERVLFEFAKPRTIVLTTPNLEYNVMWEGLSDETDVVKMRHSDHRFEWTRAEFQNWAKSTAGRFNYSVRFLPVGLEDAALGPPTQMAVFKFEAEDEIPE